MREFVGPGRSRRRAARSGFREAAHLIAQHPERVVEAEVEGGEMHSCASQ
jgi:hypothetical protein